MEPDDEQSTVAQTASSTPTAAASLTADTFDLAEYASGYSGHARVLKCTFVAKNNDSLAVGGVYGVTLGGAVRALSCARLACRGESARACVCRPCHCI